MPAARFSATPIIDCVATGTPRPLASGKSSAIAKSPVAGPVHIGILGLQGDAQADTKRHGGPEKAVHVYPRDHYRYWSQTLASHTAQEILREAGAFGENLSVRNLTEHDVCIGDIWQAGEAVLQVSQGRQPCWKLNERFATGDMSTRVQDSGRTGWYFRVLEAGDVSAGDSLTLLRRPHPVWSVGQVAHVFYRDRLNMEALAAIAALPELAASWRKLVVRRLETKTVEDWSKRLGKN